MTQWFLQIEWSILIAGFSALLASLALGFNIYWTRRQSNKEAYTKLADLKVEWVSTFNKLISRVIPRLNDRFSRVYLSIKYTNEELVKPQKYQNVAYEIEELLAEIKLHLDSHDKLQTGLFSLLTKAANIHSKLKPYGDGNENFEVIDELNREFDTLISQAWLYSSQIVDVERLKIKHLTLGIKVTD